jgi:hypothetical protein
VKKLAAILLGLAMMGGGAHLAYADGCYMCKEGGYVRYRGSDTFAKRRKAKKKCGCTVTGTTSSCSNPKCTVSARGPDTTPLMIQVRLHLGLSAPCSR